MRSSQQEEQRSNEVHGRAANLAFAAGIGDARDLGGKEFPRLRTDSSTCGSERAVPVRRLFPFVQGG
jgi:hypothetical protein